MEIREIFDIIDCQEKAYWLGFFANVGVVDNGLKHRKSTIAVTIHYSGKNVCKRILDYLYQDATIYLQRKYNKYKKYCISAE